jgi:DNA polymerase-1
VPYEHRLGEICSIMERTGFLLDLNYTKELSATLRYDESRFNEIALHHGCENVNSTEQVADVLEAMGVVIKGRTALAGKRQVNDDLLSKIAEQDGDLGVFAEAVIEAKKAKKWRSTWVDTFLKTADAGNRCHPSINPLRARTARMSITGIPAQTLPASDSTIRRCFVADRGQLIASVDYQAQELRVLAALSKDQTMIQAFKDDADLHQLTADAAGVERPIGKMANFLKVYEGGPAKLAQQAGITFPVAKRVLDAFAATYPGVGVLSAELQRKASADGFIVTPTGRRLPVDPTRAYSALNYTIQSTSRDVTGRALIRLHEAGFTPYLRLVIHDEILASLPERDAEGCAEAIGQIMEEHAGPVFIGTDPKVGKRSWGSLYGSDT